MFELKKLSPKSSSYVWMPIVAYLS